ncbi:MAG: putative lipid II flippase FtsW [Devosiaceae bacterium]|nr:putative lipid II flippase FtsW [Devosiaceae bacterium]
MFSRAKKTPIAEWWWTIDKELLTALALLLTIGMILSFAASPPVAERLDLSPWHFVIRHAFFATAALFVLVGVSFLNVRQAKISSLILLFGSIFLLIVAWRFGVEIKGSRRWVKILGQSVQPSEFVKPAFAVIAAWLFAQKMKHPDMPARSIAAGLMVLIVTLLMLQPDFGQTVLLVATWASLLFLTGISWWITLGLLGLAAGGALAAYIIMPNVARRIDGFLNPESVDTYQIDRALQSLLEGGWFGRGPGEAIVRRYVPDAHADFVFSAAAGEFGILFAMVLVALIAFITLRSLFLAQRQSSLFVRLAISALAIQFGLQAGINLTVNLNMAPATGMTLPFVSYGGTSMLATAFSVGLILAMARRKPEETLKSGIPPHKSAMVPGE